MTAQCVGYSGLTSDLQCRHPARLEIAWPFTNLADESVCGQHVAWALFTLNPNHTAIIRWLDKDAVA